MAGKTATEAVKEPAAKTNRAKAKKTRARGDSRQVTWACGLFSHLAVPLRYRIIMALAQGEQSIADLSRAIGQPRTPFSPALRLLRSSDVVLFRTDGQQRIYRLSETGMRLASIGLSLSGETGGAKATAPTAKPETKSTRGRQGARAAGSAD